METDEIIRALRNEDLICPECTINARCDGEPKCLWNKRAADLLESQQARITELEAQLAESQRRERAAVEDLRLAARESQDGMGVCVTCNHYPADMSHGMPAICNQCAGAGLCMYEWRGPQEAGEGERNDQ